MTDKVKECSECGISLLDDEVNLCELCDLKQQLQAKLKVAVGALEKIASREKIICSDGCKENCVIAPNCAIKLSKQAIEQIEGE